MNREVNVYNVSKLYLFWVDLIQTYPQWIKKDNAKIALFCCNLGIVSCYLYVYVLLVLRICGKLLKYYYPNQIEEQISLEQKSWFGSDVKLFLAIYCLE